MQVYISVDMEGASGVTRWQDVIPQGQDYQRARGWMTGDVNAAVAGARAAGAIGFVVEENHGVEMLCNLLLDEIDEEVEVVRGTPRGGTTSAAALDGSFDAMFLVGHHAKVGDFPGICAHTISHDRYKDVRLHGRSVSEGEIFATIAAQNGVPTALITGDDVVAAELSQRLPGIETAIVKKAMSRTGGTILPIRRAHAIISEAASRAMEKVAAGAIPVPDFEVPFDMEVEFREPIPPAALDRLRHMPEFDLDGDTTVRFTHAEMAVAYRMAAFVGALAGTPTLRGY